MKKTIAGIILVFIVALTMAVGTFADEIWNKRFYLKRNEKNIEFRDELSNKKSISDKFIGKDKAKEIALKKAGFNENDVYFVEVEFDNERGTFVYEVEFEKNRIEYKADVKADDGTIIDWETEYDD